MCSILYRFSGRRGACSMLTCPVRCACLRMAGIDSIKCTFHQYGIAITASTRLESESSRPLCVWFSLLLLPKPIRRSHRISHRCTENGNVMTIIVIRTRILQSNHIECFDFVSESRTIAFDACVPSKCTPNVVNFSI